MSQRTEVTPEERVQILEHLFRGPHTWSTIRAFGVLSEGRAISDEEIEEYALLMGAKVSRPVLGRISDEEIDLHLRKTLSGVVVE